MFSFEKTDVRRMMVSSIGALALAGLCVGAAIAPANATRGPVTAAQWQEAVQQRLSAYPDNFVLGTEPGETKEAVLAVRFAADGGYAGADVARSSGSAMLDAHALRIAASFHYPAMPDAMKGRARTIVMRLVFGHADSDAQYDAMRQRIADETGTAFASGAGGQVAVK